MKLITFYSEGDRDKVHSIASDPALTKYIVNVLKWSTGVVLMLNVDADHSIIGYINLKYGEFIINLPDFTPIPHVDYLPYRKKTNAEIE